MNPDIEFIRGLHVRLKLRIKGMQQVAVIHQQEGKPEMAIFFEGGYDALKDVEKTLKRYLEEKGIN